MLARVKVSQPSCPGLSRASTCFSAYPKNVDGRDKPGHDDVEGVVPATGRQRYRFRSVAASSGVRFRLNGETKRPSRSIR